MGEDIDEAGEDGLPAQLAHALPLLALHAGAVLVANALEGERNDAALLISHGFGDGINQHFSQLVGESYMEMEKQISTSECDLLQRVNGGPIDGQKRRQVRSSRIPFTSEKKSTTTGNTIFIRNELGVDRLVEGVDVGGRRSLSRTIGSITGIKHGKQKNCIKHLHSFFATG